MTSYPIRGPGSPARLAAGAAPMSVQIFIGKKRPDAQRLLLPSMVLFQAYEEETPRCTTKDRQPPCMARRIDAR